MSFFEDLSIDFPFHFITSILDVYQDTATCDKLIFPLAIMWTLRHFSIPILDSSYYTTMGAIDAGSIRRSEVQLQPKWPHIESTDPTTSTVPSTSAPFSLIGGVNLKAIIA